MAKGKSERVIVLGAGVFGAWTAHHLQNAGHKVTLIDAWGASHSRASSGGESRLTRAGYGKDAIYTRFATESLGQWQALSAVSGLPILIPCGVVFFSAVEDDYFRSSIEVHKQLGLPIEQMDRAAMQRRFPMIDFEGIEIGLFEPKFGALMARRSVQTLVDRFVRAGGEYRLGQAKPIQGDETLKTVKLQSGEDLSADRFVFALGPWLPKIFPDVLGKKIFATRQEVFYFAKPAGDKSYSPEAMPGWADFNAGDIFYGFPDLENRGVKFAHDQHGVLIDPDTQDRRPTQAALNEVVAFRDRRFPGLRGAPLTGAEVCQYENSSNGDFLIDMHPSMPNVLLVGGGSGHGFKHGPEVGRYAAARLFGAVKEEPRFSLATKGETQHREVH
ncbi:N-methyl-L-tryptophan oxidase [Sphingomonas daechungensis]|uniref:FAD-dependent oxidoreductase n=1 Tax=Sphingomonas daechungensis TaxID=1176646 RepID=A0ABX6T0K0_9SPHN|nr:FAD-dependent oxidoreductase [Sphingomonas daechungensis]QNP43357.1 FAD-dependent oxidoreductase [Sphingomonas daechungensis]